MGDNAIRYRSREGDSMATRQEAIERGLTTYEGCVCKRCGKTKKRTQSSGCVECMRLASLAWKERYRIARQARIDSGEGN